MTFPYQLSLLFMLVTQLAPAGLEEAEQAGATQAPDATAQEERSDQLNQPAPATELTGGQPPSSAARLLVLTPRAHESHAATADLVAGLVASRLADSSEYDIMSAIEVAQLVDLEAARQSTGCTDSSCLADVAGALGARLVLFGDIGNLGRQIIVNLVLFDSDASRTTARVSISVDDASLLPQEIPKGVDQLMDMHRGKRSQSRDAPASVTNTVNTDVVSPAPSSPPNQELREDSGFPTFGLVGAGTAGVSAVLILTGALSIALPYLLAASALSSVSPNSSQSDLAEAQTRLEFAKTLEYPLVGLGAFLLAGSAACLAASGLSWAIYFSNTDKGE